MAVSLVVSLPNRHPGTETTTTRRPRAPEARRDRPAADTRLTAGTTAANRVRVRPQQKLEKLTKREKFLILRLLPF